jgi:hypothetical protein
MLAFVWVILVSKAEGWPKFVRMVLEPITQRPRQTLNTKSGSVCLTAFQIGLAAQSVIPSHVALGC